MAEKSGTYVSKKKYGPHNYSGLCGWCFIMGRTKKDIMTNLGSLHLHCSFWRTGPISCMELQYLVQLCAELSILVQFLSKQKLTGSIFTFTELNKRINLQERVYRKRKYKSMVIFFNILTLSLHSWKISLATTTKQCLAQACIWNILFPRATQFFKCACH